MTTQTAHTSSPPSLEAQLEQLLQEFDAWAVNQDDWEPGWQCDWDGWLQAMNLAKEAIVQDALSPRALARVGQCWEISNEVEWCADWARQHLTDLAVHRHVITLTQDVRVDTRWQACDVLGDLPAEDAEARAALHASLEDENPYVRRRAFLALLRHQDADAPAVTARMLTDPHVYNRYVAILKGQSFSSLREQMEQASQDPEVASYLDAARQEGML